MNLITLALRNIKQNKKKYSMYIFSMSFSVFTAYTFLALMQNETVKSAFENDNRYKSVLMAFGVIILVFVLFFLISSNGSFIKARKKEISTYSLFGMTNGKIGRLLFTETMIVGISTLGIGIGVGIFFSKLVAMCLLKLTLSNFVGDISFSIDPKSIYITSLVFLVIFCAMGLSGLWVIRKFELVDLFKAEKVSEGKSKGSIPALVLSLVLVGSGYFMAFSLEPMLVFKAAIPILVLVIVGTYIFFWGGLPIVINLAKKNKRAYYKGSNLVSTSSFSHRMKSISSVMATIAVLSAVATTAIATGFTLYSNAENSTYGFLGYDAYYYGGQEDLLNEVNNVFERNNVKVEDEYKVELYETNPKMAEITVNDDEYISPENSSFRVYSQSEYNKLISFSKGDLKPCEVKSGESLYIYPYAYEDIESKFLGQPLAFSDRTIEVTSLLNSGITRFGANHTLVLNDNDFNALLNEGDILSTDNSGKNYHEAIVLNYDNALKARDVNDELQSVISEGTEEHETAYSLYNEFLKTFGLICFIGFFMSTVFILMTASLLYFKQVMSAEEERHQYIMLRKIGMDSQMEKKVIIKRLFPVFLIPLMVGIMHSIFAMKTADTVIFSSIIVSDNSYLTVLSFSAIMYGIYAIVYGVFYLITKGQYSRIVR